jgi:site-specific recombinase XerD
MSASTELSRVAISVHDESDRVAVIFYDVREERVVYELTDYSVYMADEEQLDVKTITNHSYFLKRFYEYLLDRSINLDRCTDSVLKNFRDEEKKSVLRSKASKNNIRIANGTVNERLRRIYRWLTWLQDRGRVRAELIGKKGCGVRSALPSRALVERRRRLTPNAARQQAREDYPLLFKKTARKSRHRRQFVPTEDFRFQLVERLHETAASPYIAHRNALIVDTANTVGFRRGSINSLRIAQFLDGRIEEADGSFMYVTPDAQKFGYEESFAFPVSLAQRVTHFIANYLLPTAAARGWKIDLKTSPVILSYRDGRAMRDRSITKMLSGHFRALGAPAWNATHSLRRKFANDEMDSEAEYRVEQKLDTSTQSIAATVSLRMGQHNPESLEPYLAAKITAPRLTATEQLKAHTASLEAEVLALREEVSKLRAQVAEVSTNR